MIIAPDWMTWTHLTRLGGAFFSSPGLQTRYRYQRCGNPFPKRVKWACPLLLSLLRLLIDGWVDVVRVLGAHSLTVFVCIPALIKLRPSYVLDLREYAALVLLISVLIFCGGVFALILRFYLIFMIFSGHLWVLV